MRGGGAGPAGSARARGCRGNACQRVTAGEAGGSRGVRSQSRVSCTPPLCGARLRAERAWPGHSFPRCLGPAGERRGGSARLWGTPGSPAGLTGEQAPGAPPCPWTSRGSGGTPAYARRRLALRPARRNLASRLCPGESLPRGSRRAPQCSFLSPS